MPRLAKNRPLDLHSLRGRLQSIRGGMKQSDVAAKLGLRRERYASYEAERVPLKFLAGWEICRVFDVNQLWLATGKGRQPGFLDLKIDFSEAGIDDRTPFDEGIQALWPQLVQQATRKGLSPKEIPPHPPMPSRFSEPGVSFRAVRQAAKGRISVTRNDLERMSLTVPAEYLGGISPSGAPEVVVLTHPGCEAVAEFLLPNRPRNAGIGLLRKCLAGEFRREELLNRLDPRFLLELMLAAQKLTGLVPV